MTNEAIQKAVDIAGSQKKLAEACGVKQPTVYRWLHGGGLLNKNIKAVTIATRGLVKPQDIDPTLKELIDLM